jgi:hypothetical protein
VGGVTAFAEAAGSLAPGLDVPSQLVTRSGPPRLQGSNRTLPKGDQATTTRQ